MTQQTGYGAPPRRPTKVSNYGYAPPQTAAPVDPLSTGPPPGRPPAINL